MKESLSGEDRKIEITGAWCLGMHSRSHISAMDNLRHFVTNILAFVSLIIMYLVHLTKKDVKHLI